MMISCVSQPGPLLPEVTNDAGPADTERTFAKLRNNNGVRLDDILAELLKAGGSPMAVHYSDVNRQVVANATWPAAWRGGSFTSIYKKRAIRRYVTTRGPFSCLTMLVRP